MKTTSGFTLIEVIIYMAIAGTILTALVLFSTTIGQTKQQSVVHQEASATMREIIDTIEKYTNQATSTYQTTFGVDGTLRLWIEGDETQPTHIGYDWITERMYTQKGSTGIRNYLNPLLLHVTQFELTDTTASSTRNSFQAVITIKYDQENKGGSGANTYSLTNTSTFTVRQ